MVSGQKIVLLDDFNTTDEVTISPKLQPRKINSTKDLILG